MIRLEGVSKTYRGSGHPAVRNLSLRVREQELLVLLGESGSGKTTTLKMINRLVEPSAGRVTVSGHDVLAMNPVLLRRQIGYVSQGIGLFPHYTVAENVAVVPRLLGWGEAEIAARIDELLVMVGLSPPEFRNRYPRQLSGGEVQRVGIARALAGRPGILLMDEPFGALDPLTRSDLQQQFKALQMQLGLTVVLVTHDVTEALLLADRIAVLKNGELVGEGEPARLLAEPGHLYVEALMSMPRRQARQLAQLLGTAP